MKLKSPTVAFFLNLFLPGLGFAYLGRPVLIFAGVLFFVLSGYEGLRAGLTGIDATGLAVSVGAAVCLALVAQDMTGVLNRSTPETRICPHCAEEIKAEAKVCKHCNREVQ